VTDMTGLPGLSEAERRRRFLGHAAQITQGALVIFPAKADLATLEAKTQWRLTERTTDLETATQHPPPSSVIGLVDSVLRDWQRTLRVAVLILTVCLCLSVVLNASDGFSEALAGVGGAALYWLLVRLQGVGKP
jgi:hypothetical protein